MKERQQELFAALWTGSSSAHRSNTPQQILAGLKSDLGIPVDLTIERLPDAVGENRPPADGRELAAISDLFSKVGSARRAYLTTAGALYALDALGVEFAESQEVGANLKDLLRGADCADLTAQARNDDTWSERPENRYSHPPRIGRRYQDPVDHAFATHLIEDRLFRARDRVMARILRDPVNRAFFEKDLVELQALYVGLRKWMTEHAGVLSKRALPMLRLEESLSGILAETTAFIIHGINAFIDDALIDLPLRTPESERPRLIRALGSIGEIEKNIRLNYVALFMAPASLSAEGHRAIVNPTAGSANPIRPDLLVTSKSPPIGTALPPIVVSWSTSGEGVDLEQALQSGSRCGGLDDFRGCDERSKAIIELASEKFPFARRFGRHTALNSIEMTTLLACTRLYDLFPRMVRANPRLLPPYPGTLSDRWVDEVRSGHFGMAVLPRLICPERIPLDTRDTSFPKKFPRGLYLQRWRGEEMSSWASTVLAHLDSTEWQPPWLRQALKDLRLQREPKSSDVLEVMKRHFVGHDRPIDDENICYGLYKGFDAPLGQVALRPILGSPGQYEMEAWMFSTTSQEEARAALLKVSCVAFGILKAYRLEILTPEHDRVLNDFCKGTADRTDPRAPGSGWTWREWLR